MNITVCFDRLDPAPWVQGLQAALPQAHVSAWAPGAAPADHAIVWAPPQQFIDEQTGLQAMFNIGAGVDALLKLRLPPGLKVVRLDDAGMSVQMAEYVCHAVIRHFREFDGYDADTQSCKWSYRKPRSRADFAVGVMGLGVLGERVAKALQVFDFPVNGYSRSPKQIEGVRGFAGPQALPDFLQASRILVNLMPLTPETENILNKDTLSRLAWRLPHQRRARQTPGRRRPDRPVGQRASGRGHARRVPHRALARRTPVLAASQNHRHPPHLGPNLARRKHRADRGQNPGPAKWRSHPWRR